MIIKLTKKDFDYLFEFLKENHPYSHLINFEEIYKLKDKICFCKNRSKFLDNLKIELKQKYLSNIKH